MNLISVLGVWSQGTDLLSYRLQYSLVLVSFQCVKTLLACFVETELSYFVHFEVATILGNNRFFLMKNNPVLGHWIVGISLFSNCCRIPAWRLSLSSL